MSNPQTPIVATPTSAEDIKKAQAFFDRAATVGQTGSHEYAFDMYIQGLVIHPDAMDVYKALRQLALVRSAEGGKDMSYFEKRKLPKVQSPKDRLMNAVKLFCYQPQNRERIKEAADAARETGLVPIATWFEGLLV